MSEKNSRTKAFFKSQGFLLVAILCLTAIGVIGVMASGSGESSQQEPQEQLTQSQQSQTLEEARRQQEQFQQQVAAVPTTPPITAEIVKVEPEPTAQPEASGGRTAEAAATPAPTGALRMPMSGNIISEFSGDELVFNKTLNMWATHNGIDIAPTGDSDVCAAMSGTVTAVERDQSRGISVTVTGDNGNQTIYAGLSETPLSEKDKVSAGDSIGTIGTPAFEAALGRHLHFEYIVGGKAVDPTDYMAGSK